MKTLILSIPLTRDSTRASVSSPASTKRTLELQETYLVFIFQVWGQMTGLTAGVQTVYTLLFSM